MATTTNTKTTEEPKKEKTTLARKINAWGFITLLILVFLIFGPTASFLSWRSNTLEGAGVAAKIMFAILAYIGNVFYIIWFAFMKTIVPKISSDAPETNESFSPFSPSPIVPTPAPVPAPTPVPTPKDDMMFSPKPENVATPEIGPVQPPAVQPNQQQGGKKKLKLRRKK